MSSPRLALLETKTCGKVRNHMHLARPNKHKAGVGLDHLADGPVHLQRALKKKLKSTFNIGLCRF